MARLLPSPLGRWLAPLLAALLGIAVPDASRAAGAAPLPESLHDTGLFVAGSSTEVDPAHLRFAPQYPLWSDGATKRRWIALPKGAVIDGRRPDAWDVPRGTRVWKEFAVGGRRIETRYIERQRDGTWRYATYVWNDEGTQARLAPAAGVPALPVAGAPGGRYTVPSRDDCVACHEGAPVPLLGFSALQLSPDRDPLAPHGAPPEPGAVDLEGLLAAGRLRGVPQALRVAAPRIAAATPEARAALGYLHGNCGHCHNDDGVAPAPVALRLAQRVGRPDAALQVERDVVDAPSRYRPPGAADTARVVVAGRPDQSVLLQRMRSRQPQHQMPPLGTQAPDEAALDLVAQWITGLHPLHATSR